MQLEDRRQWSNTPLSVPPSRGLIPLDQSDLISKSAASDLNIAPWLAPPQDPPSPPSPPAKKASKASSFSLKPMASQASLFSRSRTSEGALPEAPVAGPSTADFRRPKGFFGIIRRKASKPSLNKDTLSFEQASSSQATLLSLHPLPTLTQREPTSPTRKRRKTKKGAPPPVPPKDDQDLEFRLDTDLNQMDGIIDFNAARIAATPIAEGRASLTRDSFEETQWDEVGPLAIGSEYRNGMVQDEWGALPPTSNGTTTTANGQRAGPLPFINPFAAPSVAPPSRKRKAHPEPLTLASTSPITHRLPLPLPLPAAAAKSASSHVSHADENDPRWDPPQSWAVDGEEPAYYSSSDESIGSPHPTPLPRDREASLKYKGSNGALGQPLGGADGVLSTSLQERSLHGRPSIARPSYARPGTATGREVYHIRVYRVDGSYHVVSCQHDKTVYDLQQVLARKLMLTRDQYRLFLRERGRERPLPQNKRPIDILRRSLSHAGYEESDWRDNLGGEDFSYLLRFVFRSAVLGRAQEEELNLDSFEHIDLTGRGVQTIPIILYHHAPIIATLNLSKNPIVDIPLDFIQSCETLRELRLSHVSLKRVPMSIRHSTSLLRLDISCNRIIDVEDAGLHLIPDLTYINVQNNRLEILPSDFALIKNLKFLNISNNKFEKFPEVVCEMAALVDLDLSFNSISVFPPQIGRLKQLEKLVVIGNRFTSFPPEVSELEGLEILDCRRNAIGDLSLVSMLPKLQVLRAEYNVIHVLDLSTGPALRTLDASHNSITRINVTESVLSGTQPCNSLTSLNLSHAKLSSLDDVAMSQLISLKKLYLDYNQFRSFPDSLGTLSALTHLSCTDNNLAVLPDSIGQLQNLIELNVHNNNLKEIPASIWQCKSLQVLNATSNLIGVFHDPPALLPIPTPIPIPDEDVANLPNMERKGSGSTTLLPAVTPASLSVPPLAQSLQRLHLGDNRLTDDVFPPLTVLKELRLLNLSFNTLQEIPMFWLQALTQLEELYLSGNKLTSLPAEDLHRLQKLTTLFLNGNKLLTLPAELGKIKSLQVLDVGSNVLKYNINNWEFDWNWNFNPQLKYLNLSGNKRLEIKPDSTHRSALALPRKQNLAEFSGLSQLRVLGLMDVTTLFIPSVPDENEDRRVRTSFSEVNGMAYGIADTLGNLEHLSMFDLVVPRFRSKDNECLFGMFGRAEAKASSNRLTRYLHENFTSTFIAALKGVNTEIGETPGDALRRAFLSLNKTLHDYLNPPTHGRKMSHVSASTGGGAAPPVGGSATGTDPVLKSGASGVVVYIVDKTMYVANAGNSLAVVSRQGSAQVMSTKHEPFDRTETARIRAAEGWVSLKGTVNDEIDVSRSFGMYHLLPAVNSCPSVREWSLTDQDEFVIVGNRGLWDFVSYQTAVDIARTSRDDPMIAAQKLRDFAISYGAQGSTMVMVIAVGDIFAPRRILRPPTANGEGTQPMSLYNIKRPLHPKRPNNIDDARLARLPPEVPPPTTQLTLVFTDIRNSTSLWEKNAGMSTAMRLHNSLLRRQLRTIGGYEVKTEGDSFMVSFHSVLAAMLWCLTVQIQLLREDWPLEILESEDGQEVLDEEGYLIARGLSVRMGIHWGNPVCEPDPVTSRMDYFGPMVNRSARVMASAQGGQIMVSQDVVKELAARGLLEAQENTSEDTTNANTAPTAPDPNDVLDVQSIIEMLRRMQLKVIEVGEVKMKGLEIPELLTLVYPRELFGRKDLKEPGTDPVSSAAGSRVTFSTAQIRELGMLCVRLEALASERVFKPMERKGSTTTMAPPRAVDQVEDEEALEEKSVILYANPDLLMPPLSDKASDAELLLAIDSLSCRIENALSSLAVRHVLGQASAASGLNGLDLQQLIHLLQRTF